MKILVTGGASGLGYAITESLAKDGHDVFFTFCHSVEKAAQIQSKYPNTQGIKCDFGVEADLANLEQQIVAQDMDAVVHNALTGMTQQYFHKIEPDFFAQSFQLNVMPVIRLTQAALTHFRKKKFGRIVAVLTSALVDVPPLGYSEYAAQKAYIHALVKSWASENARFNITANAVSPAFMKTDLNSTLDERVVDEMEKSLPLKTFLPPEDVAKTILFLLTGSPHINGANIILNQAQHVI